MDPDISSTLYSGGYIYTTTYLMAVSKTTDSGTSWSRDTLTSAYAMCYALRIDPSNTNIVYAGGNLGVYKSTDAGATWFASTTGLSGVVYDIAVDPSSSAILYAGTSSGVFKSTNSGANWTNTGCSGANAVLIDNSSGTTVYAGTRNGVFYSTNGGGTWTDMNTGLMNTNVTSLGLNPGVYLFAGTDGAGMWRWSLAVGTQEHVKNSITGNLVCQPNPVQGVMTVQYSLSRELHATLSVYDVQGRMVASLVDGMQMPGSHQVTWDGKDLKGISVPAGIYFCRLETKDAMAIQKIIRLK